MAPATPSPIPRKGGMRPCPAHAQRGRGAHVEQEGAGGVHEVHVAAKLGADRGQLHRHRLHQRQPPALPVAGQHKRLRCLVQLGHVAGCHAAVLRPHAVQNAAGVGGVRHPCFLQVGHHHFLRVLQDPVLAPPKVVRQVLCTPQRAQTVAVDQSNFIATVDGDTPGRGCAANAGRILSGQVHLWTAVTLASTYQQHPARPPRRHVTMLRS
mmetsp:Transcript_27245/g.70007  ORF Transcript_27245/g.70007 Transcript_27245/m.70007 type:complete len:210 (-) Transcript_27245:935-1564(-)